MKRENFEHYKPGLFVFWLRQRDGLYLIKEVQRRDNSPPLLFLERVYNTSYDRETSNRKDREYYVDATYCKLVDLREIVVFEENKLKKVKSMVNSLSRLSSKIIDEVV